MFNKEFKDKFINDFDSPFQRRFFNIALQAVPEYGEYAFEVFYKDMLKSDICEPSGCAAVALVNVFDPDIIVVDKSEFIKEVGNWLFNSDTIDYEAYRPYFRLEDVVADVEREYEPDGEDAPETYAEYLKEEYGARFDPDDIEEYAIYLLENGEADAESYFDFNKYGRDVINGEIPFGPEIYPDNSGGLIVIPNLSLEKAIGLIDKLEAFEEKIESGEKVSDKEIVAAIKEEVQKVIDEWKRMDEIVEETIHPEMNAIYGLSSLDSLISEAEGAAGKITNEAPLKTNEELDH